MLDASLLKSKRVRGAGRGMFTTKNLIFFLLLGGLLFLGFLSLTWRVADPDSVRVPRPDEEENVPAAPVPKEELRLMLASHGRLMWYWPGNDTTRVLHEGQVREGQRGACGHDVHAHTPVKGNRIFQLCGPDPQSVRHVDEAAMCSPPCRHKCPHTL